MLVNYNYDRLIVSAKSSNLWIPNGNLSNVKVDLFYAMLFYIDSTNQEKAT